jgi:hypothetical protein
MYACIREYAKRYKNVYIFSLKRCEKFVKQLYANNSNIIITVLSENYEKDNKLYYNVPIEDLDKYLPIKKDEYDLIKTGNSFREDGTIEPEWNNMKNIGEFWRKFYYQAGLDYSIRYKYMNINRDHEREMQLYNKVVKKYGEKYIFIHDHGHITYDHQGRKSYLNRDIINNDIPLFHPNINFYKSNPGHKFSKLWSEDLISDNLLDYCTIIERAEKINIIDSVFICLVPYLDLSNVKDKRVKSKLNLKDYDKRLSSWKVYK